MEDAVVIKMVNNASNQMEQKRNVMNLIRKAERKAEQIRVRNFWKMVIRVLLLILAGQGLLLAMMFDQMAVWLACCGICACVVAVAINIDRYLGWR